MKIGLMAEENIKENKLFPRTVLIEKHYLFYFKLGRNQICVQFCPIIKEEKNTDIGIGSYHCFNRCKYNITKNPIYGENFIYCRKINQEKYANNIIQ